MKKIFLLLVALATTSTRLDAQTSANQLRGTQAFAISSVGGVLESKIKITYYEEDKNLIARNAADVFISLEEARNIFALNIISTDTSRQLIKIPVASFEMMIIANNKEATFPGKSDMLTDEMKKCLKDIRQGTIIYFQRINGSYNGIPGYGGVTIKYIVK
jgi:hypothetical protein